MAMTAEQIRTRGLAALRKELGAAGLIRFLQHFESGTGDYTRDRHAALAGLNIQDLRDRVASRKSRGGTLRI